MSSLARSHAGGQLRVLGGRWADALLSLALVLAGAKLTWGIERIVDIGLYDESGYLYGGVMLAEKGLFPASWAPLYAVWYHLLSLFEHDRVQLYYLNYTLLTVAPAVLLFLLMRSYRIAWQVALGVAWLFLISVVNFSVWPKPAHFALLLILLFLFVLKPSRRLIEVAPLLALGTLIVTYIRPEFLLSYLIFVAIYLALLLDAVRKHEGRRQLLPALTLLAGSTAMMAIFGIPGLDNQGSRSFEAFSQHFALNWVAWTGSSLNPWADYQQIMAANFGGATSVAGAVRAEPALVARHVLSNVARYVGTLIELPWLHFNVLLPGASAWSSYLEATLLMVVVVGYLVWRRRALFDGWRIRAATYRTFLLAAGVLALPGVISAIAIYPEQHYLITQMVLGAVTLAVLASAGREPARGTQGKWLAVGLIVVLAATPVIATNWSLVDGGLVAQDRQLGNLRTIEYLRTLQIRDDVTMLEADGGYYIYLGDHIHRVPQYSKTTDFATFLRSKRIDLIVVSDELRYDSRFRDDRTWADFLEQYARYGYQRREIPGTDRLVFVRADVLAVRDDTR